MLYLLSSFTPSASNIVRFDFAAYWTNLGKWHVLKKRECLCCDFQEIGQTTRPGSTSASTFHLSSRHSRNSIQALSEALAFNMRTLPSSEPVITTHGSVCRVDRGRYPNDTCQSVHKGRGQILTSAFASSDKPQMNGLPCHILGSSR
jgi:hypothetical protein